MNNLSFKYNVEVQNNRVRNDANDGTANTNDSEKKHTHTLTTNRNGNFVCFFVVSNDFHAKSLTLMAMNFSCKRFSHCNLLSFVQFYEC